MQTINDDRLKKAIVLTHSLIFFVDRVPLFLNQISINDEIETNWSIIGQL